MKTAIVTGVAGFIGSHLAEKLLEEKFKVIGIDSFTNYYSKTIKENNIKQCLKNKEFFLLKQDLMNLDLVPIFKKAQNLFHLAAQPGVRASWGTEFDVYVKNNILVTQKILESAKITRSLKKIVIASSSSVYGNQKGKMNEEKTYPKPISPYGTTKLATENLGLLYHTNFALPVIMLRYFTVYGPRQRPDMAFNRFINAVLTKNKITVFGAGNQTRDFTYIDDVVSATLSALEGQLDGEVINIGGGHIITINQVLDLLKTIANNEIKVLYQKEQKGDVKHTQADISKAKKLLNYRSKTQINSGLQNEFNYIKKNLHNKA